MNQELFEINGIKMDFRNKYKLMEFVNPLKDIVILLKPVLENNLMGIKIMKKFEDKIDMVHISITDPLKDGDVVHFGLIGRLKYNKRELIMPLRLVSKDYSANNFYLMETFIHEFLHLYIKGEKNVKIATEIVMESIDKKTKEKIGKIWGIENE